MWFDNLDPDEIREHLLAEGDFTKLLESLGLNDPDDDDTQESPTLEENFALLKSAMEDILLPRLGGTSNTEVVKQVNCKHIRANNGIGILEPLAEAKESIFATHVNPDVYVELYAPLQLEKVNQGLVFERILYKNPVYPHTYKWLERFRDKNGQPIKRYREYTIESDSILLLPKQDFMVIDKKYVLLWHRVTDPESETLTFIEDEATAGYFLDWWNSLMPKEGQQRKVVEMVLTASSL